MKIKGIYMKLFKSIISLLLSCSFIFSSNAHTVFEDTPSIQITIIEQDQNNVIVHYKINFKSRRVYKSYNIFYDYIIILVI